MKLIFAFLLTSFLFRPQGWTQPAPERIRKATLEIRHAEEEGQFVLNLDGDPPELQFDSTKRSLRVKLSKEDADYLTRLFKELPVVPTLPADCARDYAHVSFSPDDKRPRATCLMQKTKFSSKYRHLIGALDLALVKSTPVPTPGNKDAKPAPGRSKGKPGQRRTSDSL